MHPLHLDRTSRRELDLTLGGIDDDNRSFGLDQKHVERCSDDRQSTLVANKQMPVRRRIWSKASTRTNHLQTVANGRSSRPVTGVADVAVRNEVNDELWSISISRADGAATSTRPLVYFESAGGIDIERYGVGRRFGNSTSAYWSVASAGTNESSPAPPKVIRIIDGVSRPIFSTVPIMWSW